MNKSQDNSNMGLVTKIWGGPAWEFLHAVTFGYPVEPTQKDKDDYMIFFKSLANVLPCGLCRDSYKVFIEDLNYDKLASREALTRWLYEVHNRVNNKLDVDYGVTYEDVCIKYENIRAKCAKKLGCTNPLHEKNMPYHAFAVKDCPIIDIKLIDPIIDVIMI